MSEMTKEERLIAAALDWNDGPTVCNIAELVAATNEFRVLKKARVGYLAVYTGTHGGILKTDVDIAAVELAPVEPLLRDGMAISKVELSTILHGDTLPGRALERIIKENREKAELLVNWDE